MNILRVNTKFIDLHLNKFIFSVKSIIFDVLLIFQSFINMLQANLKLTSIVSISTCDNGFLEYLRGNSKSSNTTPPRLIFFEDGELCM